MPKTGLTIVFMEVGECHSESDASRLTRKGVDDTLSVARQLKALGVDPDVFYIGGKDVSGVESVTVLEQELGQHTPHRPMRSVPELNADVVLARFSAMHLTRLESRFKTAICISRHQPTEYNIEAFMRGYRPSSPAQAFVIRPQDTSWRNCLFAEKMDYEIIVPAVVKS